MDVDDYLIDLGNLDWQAMFSHWQWLIKPGTDVQPWLMNCFGDLFWLDAQDAIHLLDVTSGEDERLAANEQEFLKLLEDEERIGTWLLLGFVDELRKKMQLAPGECFGFKQLPILGGDYEVENVYVSPIANYWAFCGQIHEQIVDLPDGSPVQIKIPPR